MKRFLRVALSIGLLVFLASRIDLDTFWRIMLGAHPGWLLATVAVLVGMKFYAAYRWLVLLRCGDARAHFGDLVRIIFASGFYGMFLPGGGEDVIRAIGQGRRSDDLTLSVSSVLLDRMLGVTALAGLSLVGLALAGNRLELGIEIWALSILVTGVLFFIASTNARVRALLERIFGLGWLRKFRNKILGLVDSLHLIQSNTGTMAWAVLLSMGLQFLRVITVYLAALSFDVHLPFALFVAFGPLIYFVQLLPISVGGFGTREAIFIYLFGAVGVPSATSFAMSLLLYFAIVIAGLPGAWVGHRAFAQLELAGGATTIADRAARGGQQVRETDPS